MANRGNLYWEISFTALYNGAVACTENEKIDVSVNAHDFADAYNKAKKMYVAILLTCPAAVQCVTVTLKDDGTGIRSAKYTVYQMNYVLDTDVEAFFSAGADTCMGLTWRG